MTIFKQFAGNALAEPFRAGLTTTPDGFDLRYAVFRSDVAPSKGTVLLLHGRNECIEKYAETIADLVSRGFDVGTFDWRGQGGSTRFFSDGRRGHVDDYAQYVTDLNHCFEAVFLAETRPPFYILAHSMGALVALCAVPVMVNRIRRMVFSAPFLGLGPASPSPAVVGALTGALRYLGMGRAYAGARGRGMPGRPFERNGLTSDPVRYARNQKIMDPAGGLGLGGPTVGWLRASLSAMARVQRPDHMAGISIPVLMVAAGDERIVDPGAPENYARQIRAGSTIVVVGARHELMQEADRYRDQFWAAFDAFVPGTAQDVPPFSDARGDVLVDVSAGS